MQRLKVYSKQDVFAVTKLRRFETKIGEMLQLAHDAGNIDQSLQQSKAKFVLVGVPEDIGVMANDGTGGTNTVWKQFMEAFLNVQSNDFFEGTDVMLLGHFDFSEINALIESNAYSYEEKTEAYRHAVNSIDDAVEQVVKLITSYKKIPIVIGGGHNNAYGCLKGAAKGWHKAGILPLAQLNAVNLDAQSDYGPAEGRHSANAFRYAEDDGYLEKYCVIGLHENYLPQNSWLDIVNNPFLDFVTYEDIFLHGKQSFLQAVQHAIDFTSGTLCGVELDMSSIQDMLTSFQPAAGVSPLHARQYVHLMATQGQPAYLHIAEGAAQLHNGRTSHTTGKMISYLVSDFIKGMQY